MANAGNHATAPSAHQRSSRLFLSLLMGMIIALAQSRPVPGQLRFQTYDQLLDSLAQAPLATQIARLQNFLAVRPLEERTYLKLFERYLLGQKNSEARAFFQAQTHKPERRRNSFWMLAKLAALDTLARATAGESFSQALRDSLLPPSPALLFDYAEFLHQHARPPQASRALANLKLRPEHELAVAAFAHYQNGDYGRALAALRSVSRETPPEALMLYVMSDAALNHEATALATRAQQADSLCRIGLAREDALEWRARFWAKRGDLAFTRNEYDSARVYYLQADTLARRCDDLHARQKALAGFGKLHYMNHEHEHAAARYEQALTLAEKIFAYRDLCVLYSNYCHLLYEKGRLDEALRACRKGEGFAARLRDKKRMIALQIEAARTYYALAQVKLAKRMCLDARESARDHYAGLHNRAERLLAEIALREKEYENARALCFKIIRYLEANHLESDLHNYLGIIADTYNNKTEAKYDSARAYYRKAGDAALAGQSGFYYAWYMMELADLEINRGNCERALQILAPLHPTILQENDAGLLTRLRSSLGRVYQKLGAWDRAIAAYREAAALIDSTRQTLEVDQLRIGYFSERTRAYQGLAECYFQRYQSAGRASDLDSLFHCEQMITGRSFHDLLMSKAPARNEANPSLENYRRAREELQKLQRRLRQTSAEDEAALSDLETARFAVIDQRLRLRPRDGVATHEPGSNVVSLSEAVKILKPLHAALLLYHISEEAAFVLAVAGETCRAVPLPATLAELDAAVDSLMSPFHALDPGRVFQPAFHTEPAHRIYELLFQPVVDALPHALPANLIIAPAPVLMNLPFEMLLRKPQKKAVYTPFEAPEYTEDFLLHRHAVVYNPAFGLLQKSATPRTAGVLIFANPFAYASGSHVSVSYPGTRRTFEPLPFADLEADRIAKLSRRVQIRRREQATQATFEQEARARRVLHLATHAFVDPGFNEFSGLVLAASEDSTDDGFWMGYEIADQNLQCDLITLSACETGLGELAEGEGVLGLPRLFLRAGAKSVLMTLWQVDDKFASELMPKFYDYFLNEEQSKIQALAQAKRDLLRMKNHDARIHYQHPYYWAAFTLYGDPGSAARAKKSSAVLIGLFAILILAVSIFYFRFYHKH